MISKKEKWIEEHFKIIREKGLVTPFRLNSATLVTDLNKYLSYIENVLLSTENKRLKKLFIDKTLELVNYDKQE